MADKRRFRFRFPWSSNSTRSKEEPEPRPAPKTQNPAQSTSTVVPVDRPPFRPAGKAPVKSSPSQVQEPKKTDPPSRAAGESPNTPSPSRLSPSKKSHSTTQQSSSPSSASSQSQLVKEEAISQPQKGRRKIEIISETDSSAEDSTHRETISQTRETSPKNLNIFASSDKSDSDTPNGDQKQLSEVRDSKGHKEAEKVVQVPAIEEKTNDDTEPLQERITQLHAAAKDSGNHTKDPLGVALQAGQRRKKQEAVTELHAAPTDSGNDTKEPIGVALPADQRREKQETVTKLHGAREMQEAVTELHAAPTDSGNDTNEPIGVALQADQRREKQETVTKLHGAREKQEAVTELHAAPTDSGNDTNEPIRVALQADQRREKQETVTELHGAHEKQEAVTELHAAPTDSGNDNKEPIGVALQADQQREKQETVTELHGAPTDSGNHTKEPIGAALQTEQQHEKREKVAELHAAATNSPSHTKDPLGVAMQADQQHNKQDTVTEVHAAPTESGNHTKNPLGVAVKADQRGEEKENFDRKEILGTTSSGEKPIKTERSSSRVSIRKMVASNGERAPPNKEIKEDVSKVDKLAITHQPLDKPVGVVTLTGENRGAAMLLSLEPEEREEQLNIRHNYKLNPDDNEATTTDGEVSTREEIFEDLMNDEDHERKTYINSNVQSVNNSIVFSSSVTERNPGVAIFSSDPPETTSSNSQTHMSQVIQTPANRLTHESTVRRRCLRGLFLESSDSEPDNPSKPRRHGCRYVCGKESKETEIGIV